MMSKFFINRPIFATVLSILIVVAGVISLSSLPVEQYPTITPPTVVVEAQYPGANATTIAQMVATPIEQQVNGVEGMLYMSSTSSSAGIYKLTVTFEVGTDLDMATVLVQNRVNIAQSALPQEVTKLGITTTKESTNVVMFLTLTSDNPSYDALYLSNYAELNLVNELSRIKGVGSVGSFGAGNYSMRVWLDPNLLAIRDVSPEEIISAIESQNIQVAPGSVGAPPLASPVAFQYTLETQGLLVNEEEFGNIIIKALQPVIQCQCHVERWCCRRHRHLSASGCQRHRRFPTNQSTGKHPLVLPPRRSKPQHHTRHHGIYSRLHQRDIQNFRYRIPARAHRYTTVLAKLAGDADPVDSNPRLACRNLCLHEHTRFLDQHADSFRTGTRHRTGSRRRHYHRRE